MRCSRNGRAFATERQYHFEHANAVRNMRFSHGAQQGPHAMGACRSVCGLRNNFGCAPCPVSIDLASTTAETASADGRTAHRLHPRSRPQGPKPRLRGRHEPTSSHQRLAKSLRKGSSHRKGGRPVRRRLRCPYLKITCRMAARSAAERHLKTSPITQ